MKLPKIITAIVSRFTPPLPETDRAMSTPEDVRWQRRRLEMIRREAEMLGIDTSLDKAEGR